MKKKIQFAFLITILALTGKTQTPSHVFDTTLFNKQLDIANYLIEYTFFTQLANDKYSKTPETFDFEWFSYKDNNTWHSVGGNSIGNTFHIKAQITFDSLYNISDYNGISDSVKLNSLGSALAFANTQFQIIRDSSSIYFNSFVISNPDQTISIRYLPAFQPSGQALYGCEWEYIFDKTGLNLISQNSYINRITGVWIGQPRELWLNYRSIDRPTVGSIFFALYFRDYFTRIRIDTQISTSTTTKAANGNYKWVHKMK
jgi:hypothetical protein